MIIPYQTNVINYIRPPRCITAKIDRQPIRPITVPIIRKYIGPRLSLKWWYISIRRADVHQLADAV